MTMALPVSAPAIEPAYWLHPAPRNEPPASMTTATPRDAPVEMPRIDGPASGLSKQVCSSRPAIERAAPATAAVIIIGNRVSIMMTLHVSRLISPPVSTAQIWSAGMSTDPMIRHPVARSSETAARIQMIAACCLRRDVLESIFRFVSDEV